MFYSVLDTVRRDLNIWSSMNVCDQLTESLLNVHRVLGSRDRRSRVALDVLLEVGHRYFFSADTHQEIRAAYEAVTKVRVAPMVSCRLIISSSFSCPKPILPLRLLHSTHS